MVEKMDMIVKFLLQYQEGRAIICLLKMPLCGHAGKNPLNIRFAAPLGGVHKPSRAAVREDRGALWLNT